MNKQQINKSLNLGDHLRTIRNVHHMTQSEVVTYLQLRGIDISRGSYSHIEMGRRNIPIEVLVALKELYHMTLDELLDV